MPSSPPVRPSGLRPTITEPAWANASVTMAKGMPLTRRLMLPTTWASTITISRVRPMAGSSGMSRFCRMIASP